MFRFISSLLLSLFLIAGLNAQIVIKELGNYKISASDLSYLDNSSIREKTLLNGAWKVYDAEDSENKVTVNIPSVFIGERNLVFEKTISIDKNLSAESNYFLHFLGISYSADIYLNDILIHKHPGGEFAFNVVLPRDVLSSKTKSVIKVVVDGNYNSDRTIPSKQAFLYPVQSKGIFRDVYLSRAGLSFIASHNEKVTFSNGYQRANLNLQLAVNNGNYKKDSLGIRSSNFRVRVKLTAPFRDSASISSESGIDVQPGKEQQVSIPLDLTRPMLWTPLTPYSYILTIQLYSGEKLIDEVSKNFSLYELKAAQDGLYLNGSQFKLNGVTLIPTNDDKGSMMNYTGMLSDLKMIKELGFNAVRFEKNIPHPYYIHLCEQLGLIPFVELPLISLPEGLLSNNRYTEYVNNYITLFMRSYQNSSVIGGFGLGSGYLGKSQIHSSFLSSAAAIMKKHTNSLLYASFADTGFDEIAGIDLYGIESFNQSFDKALNSYNSITSKIGKGRVIFSQAGYVIDLTTEGNSSLQSPEMQAKFFEELIDHSETNQTAGFFLSTMFDYRASYNSVISGYRGDNLIVSGIIGEDRTANRPAYKVIDSKLHNKEKVTISLGFRSDDSPMVFIIFGFVLAVIVGLLINSGKKFREDATRALLRPYNFFSDIRDLRIISGIQTTILGVLTAGLKALILSSIFYYLRFSPELEKVLLSFGSYKLIGFISYITWNPVSGLFILTGLLFLSYIALTVMIKIFAFFVTNKVSWTNAYFSVLWSTIPYLLLLPLGIVLYRLLSLDSFNLYLYLFLLVFLAVGLNRLIMGVHVIYDVARGKVYLYSALVLALIITGVLLWFQSAHSSLDYILQAVKEIRTGA